MISLAVQFLEGLDDDEENVVQRHIREDIRYVVVDEYQDVNPLQERLVRGLTQFGANLCVVGDDDQTIYQWRGSEVANIVSFRERYDDVRQVTLADNFRSSQAVVEVGRSVAELIPDDHRLPKAMVAAGNQSYDRGDLLASEFPDERDARPRGSATGFKRCADSLSGYSRLEPRGLSWSDFAVLFRSVAGDAGPLVEEMRQRDIPYVVKGLNRLFDSPEIQAVVGVFRYMTVRDRPAGPAALWDGCKSPAYGGNWQAAHDRPQRRPRLRPRRALGRVQHPAPLPGVSGSARTA